MRKYICGLIQSTLLLIKSKESQIFFSIQYIDFGGRTWESPPIHVCYTISKNDLVFANEVHRAMKKVNPIDAGFTQTGSIVLSQYDYQMAEKN